MRLIRTLLFIASIVLSAQAQDIRYQSTTIEEVVAEWNLITKDNGPGISMLPEPRRISLQMVLEKYPYTCDPTVLLLVAKAMRHRIPIQPKYYCAAFRTEQGREVRAHIGLGLVKKLEDLAAETRLNTSARLLAYITEADSAKNAPLIFVDNISKQ